MTQAASPSPLPETSVDQDEITGAAGSRRDGGGGDRPAARGPRRWFRPTPYRITALLALLVLVPMCVVMPWSGDIGQHASTIWRLRENLGDPTSPMIDVPGDGSPYFSPYQVVAALVSLATGWTPLQVLHAMAVLNVLLVLAGIGAFVRALTTRPWAPVIALLTYFFLWGTDVSVWSGYESFLSFSLGVSYPSAFAAGLMFLLWAGTLRLLGRVPGKEPLSDSLAVRIPAHLVAGLTLFVILLSHPFTGIVVCLGLVGIILGSIRGLSLRDWLLWSLSAAVLLVGILAWPYWSLFDLEQSAALDSMHRSLYERPLKWFGLALVLGLFALVMRFRRDRLDPLVLTAVLIGSVVAYGWFSGHYSWGRAYPGLIVMLQLAVALEVARVPVKGWSRRAFALVVAAALVFGLWVQAGAVFYLVPKKYFPTRVVHHVQAWNPWPGYGWATKYLEYGDVVMAAGERPLVQLPAYGYYTVQAGYPDPAVPQEQLDERARDTSAFFSREATATEKRRLVDKYHVEWVIVRPKDGVVPSGPGFTLVTTSPQGEALVKVTEP
ncbi:hypothetical protein ACIRBX_30045 [Kitasatospora sp. NPDC096147]|uniref:hypothetical protein n=1 Tax=Kitasatospora sp. NPDC096147 TaxID=3364093 RepID=UPI0037FD20AB